MQKINYISLIVSIYNALFVNFKQIHKYNFVDHEMNFSEDLDEKKPVLKIHNFFSVPIATT